MALIKTAEGEAPPPCCNHEHNAATHTCNLCGAPVCDVCLFQFDIVGDCCPACAQETPEVYPPKRRQTLIGAYIVGVISLGMVGLFASGALAYANPILTNVLYIVAMGFCVSGLALAAAALNKARSNPAGVWGAVVLNSIPVATLLLLTVVGLLMGG